MKSGQWLKAVAVAVIVVGYPVVMHLLLTSEQWPATTLVFGLLPFGLLPLGLLKTGRVVTAILLAAAMLVVLSAVWAVLLERQEWLYLIQNIGMQGLMAGAFGHTLLPPREALITQLARRLHKADFTPAIARYTRGVTWAWVGFFVAMALISIVLFAAAPLEVWSFFINVLYLPLLALMFILEYAIRRICLRGVNHLSLLSGVVAYWDKPVPPVDEKT